MKRAIGLAGLAALLVFAIAGPTAAAPTALPPLDVELAIDTTGSMGPTIVQAQEDAKKLVASIKGISPSSRFAVVQFKDSTDEVEYELVQAFTSDAAKIHDAVSSLTASGGEDNPEAYNLVFQSSIDSSIGWGRSTRKLVVVMGDAEPHGAATAGFAGCADRTTDPNGLDTKALLASMKASERTLIMVRQVSSKTTTSLQCYASLAAASYKGGTAKDGGSDLAALVTTLVGKAVDTVKPAAKARASKGVRGKPVKLLYTVSDNSGLTKERITVYRKTRVVFQGLTKLAKGPSKTFLWRPRGGLTGTLRFSVRAVDAAGNMSPPSYATVTIR
jgi:von Willebrand factor type A domain